MQHPGTDTHPIPATAIVGAGRVGSSIARSLAAAGVEVRTTGRDDLETTVPGAGCVLLCVPDDQIEAAAGRVAAVAPNLSLIGHTSGATGLDALGAATSAGATAFSVHPLQTIPTPDSDLTGAPAAIAGASPEALGMARSIALACHMEPFEVPEEARAAYHAAASMASNFLVALEASAEELLATSGVEDGREILTPLVLTAAANWSERGAAALTGPIARGDEETVRRHAEAIAEVAPHLSDLYEAMAERTRAIAASGAHR